MKRFFTLNRVLLMLIAILIINNIVNIYYLTKNKEDTVVEAFNTNTYAKSSSRVSAVAQYPSTYMKADDMKELIAGIATNIGLDNNYEISTDVVNNITVVKVYKKAQAATTTITFTSTQIEKGVYEIYLEQYINIDIEFSLGTDNAIYYYNKIMSVLENHELSGNGYIVLEGEIYEIVESKEAISRAMNMINEIDATVVSSSIIENRYVVYAYSKEIDDYIVSEGKRININIIIRYDYKNNKTYITFATPIMNEDY